MAVINLRERDGIDGRLAGVKCPVLWVHRTDDVVHNVANVQEEIKMFLNSEANLVIMQVVRISSLLRASHPEEVDRDFTELMGKSVNKHSSSWDCVKRLHIFRIHNFYHG
jgi:hypothetical protein